MRNIIMETLARAEYTGPALRNAKQLGIRQYVDVVSKLAPFKAPDTEGMHRSHVILTKHGRVSQMEITAFAKELPCFCNMLGVSYYMPFVEFCGLFSALARIFKEGSTVILDRPDHTKVEEMEKMLEENGFLIYEYIMADEIQARFLDRYSRGETKFSPIENINFFMAVKKG